MNDGYLKIKTKIDNKEVDKGVKELEDKIKKMQIENSQDSQEESALQQEIDNFTSLQKQADEYRNKLSQLKAEEKTLRNENPALAVQVDTEEMTNLKAQISQLKEKYAQAVTEIDKQAPKIEKVRSKLDKVKTKQTENNNKISEFKKKIESIKINNIENSLSNIGEKLSNQIAKIGKMAIGIAGVRMAWSSVKSMINTVAQYNPQIATDIEYIQYVLANTLLPIVQKLISLAYTLLSYINAITSAWFGLNLFSNSSVSAFKSMSNSASSTAKSIKEASKALQGFDEMNVLQDSSSDSSGDSGGTSGSTPSVDLSQFQADIPDWLQWIIDNKDLVLSIIAGITSALILMKVLGLDPITSLGIGALIGGIVYAVQSLIDYLGDPSWENFGSIIQGVGIAIIGLGAIIGSVPVAVAGAIILIIGTITKYWEQIKSFFQGGIDWLAEKSDWVHEMFGDTLGNIYDMFVNIFQQVLNILDSLFTTIKGVFDGIITFITGVFTGDWEKAWQGIKTIFTSIWEGIKGVFFAIWNIIVSVVSTVGSTVGNIISGAFKAVVNAVLWAIENILNAPIRAINGLIGVINSVPGINLGKLSTFNLPRLAKGGIIAQPTPVIAGEAGKEAIMPLENNTEWMDYLADKLGSKIGSGGGYYIIQLDGRTIEKGQSKRKKELSFAQNGG